jgi:hypothetical protein
MIEEYSNSKYSVVNPTNIIVTPDFSMRNAFSEWQKEKLSNSLPREKLVVHLLKMPARPLASSKLIHGEILSPNRTHFKRDEMMMRLPETINKLVHLAYPA